jgi:hypothetical protein
LRALLSAATSLSSVARSTPSAISTRSFFDWIASSEVMISRS